METPALQLYRNRNSTTDKGPGGDGPHDITSLQIRTGDGRSSLVLKMRFYDTIGNLINVLEASRTDLKGVKYELRTRYPNRAYQDREETLIDAGLIPNATILIKKLPAAEHQPGQV